MKNSDFQVEFDKFNKFLANNRAKSQMTLGGLISILKTLPDEFKITGLTYPHSYRGYYSDLAFELSNDKMYARDFLKICEKCVGDTFEGYKGGDNTMSENTPVWIAEWGCSGNKFVKINNDGKIETLEDDVMICEDNKPKTIIV